MQASLEIGAVISGEIDSRNWTTMKPSRDRKRCGMEVFKNGRLLLATSNPVVLRETPW